VRGFWIAAFVTFVLSVAAMGHVVTQVSADWKGGERWKLEVLFDAGYAVPEWRDDAAAAAPTRDWLAALGEPGWGNLRREAERYLRECLVIRLAGRNVDWRIDFPDFDSSPPDFPVLLNDGAYFRMVISGEAARDDSVEIAWQPGSRPSLVIRLPGEDGRYLTLAAGESAVLPGAGQSEAGWSEAGRPRWVKSFRQGFIHVLPLGLDHVLFVLGLFFYQRAWRPLLAQSLVFTAAHTVTLGFAAAGVVRVPGHWVEPMIALSLAAVALGNLRGDRISVKSPRLWVVFGFGLVHGLGFAGALSVWVRPGDGFPAALVCVNLGVEAAQVVVLLTAWILTVFWHGMPIYQKVRTAACLGIALMGGWLFAQRIWVRF
jgi:hypothetical protein